jgi:IS605 OrfB family transposase
MAIFTGHIERNLFLEGFIKEKSRNECKKEYTRKYNITSRQFNAIYIQLQGKIDSIVKLNKLHAAELEDKIKSIEKYITKDLEDKSLLHQKLLKLEKVNPHSKVFAKVVKQYRNIKFKLHQKKRKLNNCKWKLSRLQEDMANNKIRICFGSKALFNKQFHLEENKYKSHSQWKDDWIRERNSQFFCIGSKDESSGNQTCTYSSNGELRLRVAGNFEKAYGKYIVFENISFPYGQEEIDNAIKTYIGETKGGKPVKYCNSSIGYRFIKNAHGWYINATVDTDAPDIVTSKRIGCIGVDMNGGFVSCCEVDRFGNPLRKKKDIINMYNRSADQVSAAIGEAVKDIVNKAVLRQIPIAIEELDFSKKKAILGEESKKYSRMLSGFSYSKFNCMLKSRAFKYGIEIIEVDPAYTSVIGQIKFMKRYGLSPHGSAACVIARRGLGLNIEQPKYDSILGDFSKFNDSKPLKSRWAEVAYSIKKQYNYKDRIELLKLEG